MDSWVQIDCFFMIIFRFIKTDFISKATTQIYNNHAPSVCDITYIAYTW